MRGEVVRVVDGIEVRGRFVTDRAYASYLRGAEYEARGQSDDALAWYRDAARWDGDSPEIWTRIAALSCQAAVPEDEADLASSAFARAAELDADYEPLWRERARCASRRGQTGAALLAARRAVALDPEREETVLLLVELLQQASGEGTGAARAAMMEEASRWLRDLTLRSPDSMRLWAVVRGYAARAGDEAWAHEAEGRLAQLGERLDGGHPVGERAATASAPPSPWTAVDRALLRGSLQEARSGLLAAHLDSRLLAARAIAVGRAELAREEASLRSAADPADADARVALALAADLSGDRSATREALRALEGSSQRLGGTARWLFAELLWRRGGKEAAQLWLGGDAAEIQDLDGLRAALLASFDAQLR